MGEAGAARISGWLAGIGLGAFALLLVAAAVPQFLDGVAVDGAIPVPAYLIQGRALEASQYRNALSYIARADPANGDAMIAAAEMAMLAGAPPQSQAQRLKTGLSHAPASARGWLLLSAALPDQPNEAAAALSQSFLLSHYDYWIAGRRAQAAARLWPHLDRGTREMALRQTVEMWEEPALRPQLPALLAAPGGVALARNAFAFLPDEQAQMNRWLRAHGTETGRP